MKKFTKLLGIVLIIALVMSMGITAAFATDPAPAEPAAETVSITVSRDSTYAGEATADSRNFTWYRIFTATYGSDFTGNNAGGGYTSTGGPGDVTGDTEHAVAYTATPAVAAILGSIDATTKAWTTNEANKWFNLTYIPGTGNYSVSWRTGVAQDADTAQEAAAWLIANNAYEATGKLAFNSANATWGTDGLTKGYYVLESEAGKNLIAATTDITVNEKNDYPPLDKTQADEDNTTQGNTDVNVAVGDVIDYEVKVTIPKTAKVGDKIVVWDKASTGLTYNNDVEVKTNAGSATVEPGTKGSNYTGTGSVSDATWNQLITVTANSQGKDVVFKFSMTVNDSAIVDTGKENESGLKYGRGEGETPFPYESTPDKVQYKIYYAGIEKIDGQNASIKLEGVKFTLTENGTAFNVTKSGEFYIPGGSSNEVVTAADGTIKIRGLDNDKTYVLTETENPNAGYNMLAEPVTLTKYLDSVTTITYNPATTYAEGTQYYSKSGDTYSAVEIADADAFAAAGELYTVTTDSTYETASPSADSWQDVENNKGTVLPSTGGIGTTIFYVVGAILVVAAGVLLITKKRMSREG